MSDDRRHANNQTLAQRRQSVYKRRSKKPKSPRSDALAKAKDVLRRTGKTVFEAKVDQPRFKGTIVVDTRRMSPDAVIELAEQVLERERLRNNELRAQHGLAPRQRSKA